MKIERALVVGMARSGIAAVKLLRARGAQAVLSDIKPRAEFGDAIDEIDVPGVESIGRRTRCRCLQVVTLSSSAPACR